MPILFLSHGAGGDWFVVEPRDNPEQQVRSLLAVGRQVQLVDTDTDLAVDLSESSAASVDFIFRRVVDAGKNAPPTATLSAAPRATTSR